MDLLADPLFVAASIIGVCLLGLSKGGFFGLGMMALPLMAITVPPMQAAAILLPTVLAQDALTIWAYRRDWSAWNLKIMIPSMAVGIAVATLLAASLSATHIRLAIGLIALAFVLPTVLAQDALTIWAYRRDANAGGPAWQIHLLPQGLDKLTFAGTMTMLFAASNLMKIPAYGAIGQLTFDNLAVGAALLPAAMIANYAGIWLVRRTPAELFFRIVYVLMLLIAVELIRGSLVELWRG
jgi:hypothetical protein